MKPAKHSLAILALIASILACNLPSAEQVPPPSDLQTEAALTVQALLAPSMTATLQEQAPLPDTATPTITVTSGPTATITPTYSTPMLRVLEQTNCRTGPGTDYEVVYTYLAWKELVILGAYPQENYWLVKSPESPTGQCWLWGEYVEVSGSYWVVSSVTPPPTATMPPPASPSIDEWTFNCSVGQVTVNIQWTDHSDNETGHRIIRNNVIVMELSADAKSYTETIPYTSGEYFVYFIEVYNGSGSTRSTQISFSCP